MRSYCCLVLMLAGMNGVQALDRRPALAIRSIHEPLHTLRGGARYERETSTPLIDGRVKTVGKCIRASQLIAGVYVGVMMVATGTFWYMLADSLIKAAVFVFITQRILQAWRPQEFDQACLDKGVEPKRLHELALTVLLICFVSLAGYWINTKLLPWAAFAFYGFALLIEPFIEQKYEAWKRVVRAW